MTRFSVVVFHDDFVDDANKENGWKLSKGKRYKVGHRYSKQYGIDGLRYKGKNISLRAVKEVIASDFIVYHKDYKQFHLSDYRFFYSNNLRYPTAIQNYAEHPRPKIRNRPPQLIPFQERAKAAKDLTIGSDPEFTLFDNHSHQIDANAVFHTRGGDEVGCDGCGDTGEIRPKYGKTAKEHITHMAHAIHGIFSKTSGRFDADVVGNQQALGCHIHFGGHGLKKNKNRYDDFASYLDRTLGDKLVDLSGRARGGYKQRHSWREQPHGMEYRSLPSLAISDPQIAETIFSIAHATIKRALVLQKPTADRFFAQRKTVIIDKLVGADMRRTYYNFCREYETEAKRRKIVATLLENWGIKKKKKIEKEYITFSHDYYTDKLKSRLTSRFKKYKREIIFIGMHERRGDAYYINKGIENLKKLCPEHAITDDLGVDRASLRDDDRLFIGLPFQRRIDDLKYAVMNPVLDAIAELIQGGVI